MHKRGGPASAGVRPDDKSWLPTCAVSDMMLQDSHGKGHCIAQEVEMYTVDLVIFVVGLQAVLARRHSRSLIPREIGEMPGRPSVSGIERAIDSQILSHYGQKDQPYLGLLSTIELEIL